MAEAVNVIMMCRAQAQTAHGLIKLLYGGTSSLSFSAKEAVSFLQGKRRTQILGEVAASGVILQWIDSRLSITDNAEIKNAPGIAESLISVAAKQEPANTWESVHRIIAEYLAELFEKLQTEKERLRFVKTVTSQQQNLFIAEHFLASLSGCCWPLEKRTIVFANQSTRTTPT